MKESIEQIRARVKNAQRNYSSNVIRIENILKRERGYASRPPINEEAVVLMSGGLDSTVMVNKIIEDWNVKVFPLFVRRGSKNQEYEEKSFDFFSAFYTKKFPNNFMKPRKLDYQVPPADLKNDFPKNFALTVGHPMRNSTLQNLAIMYAVSLSEKSKNGVYTVLSGSVAEDNTEPELGILTLRTQTLNTCVSLGDWRWNITSPLTDPYFVKKPVSKVDLINYATIKFIPLEETRTCFSADEKADGTCHACVKRMNAFTNSGSADNIKYSNRRRK